MTEFRNPWVELDKYKKRVVYWYYRWMLEEDADATNDHANTLRLSAMQAAHYGNMLLSEQERLEEL